MEIRQYREAAHSGIDRSGMKSSRKALLSRSWIFWMNRRAKAFSPPQPTACVTEDEGKLVGLYDSHPNNVGAGGDIANASYAVDLAVRGKQ